MEHKLDQILKNQVIIMRALGNLGVGPSTTEALDTKMMETAILLNGVAAPGPERQDDEADDDTE
jgi:hypothetical protein